MERETTSPNMQRELLCHHSRRALRGGRWRNSRISLSGTARTLRDRQPRSSPLPPSCTVDAGVASLSFCWRSSGGPGPGRFCPRLVHGGGVCAVAASGWRSFQIGSPSVGLRLV